MRHEQGRERRRCRTQECNATAPIRMQRIKTQIEPRDLKQEPEPNENALIPAAEEDKLEDRQTDVRTTVLPLSSFGPGASSRVPSI